MERNHISHIDESVLFQVSKFKTLSLAAYILGHREATDESINIHDHYIILVLEDLLCERANQHII